MAGSLPKNHCLPAEDNCLRNRNNVGVQCEALTESAFYAHQHKEPQLTILNSLQSFPPIPPLHPLSEDALKEILAENLNPNNNDQETEKLMRDFKTSRPTLLPLKLEWTFGINRHVPFINLSTDNQKSIFYCIGHTAVVYSYEHDGKPIEPRQILFEGLDRQISCLATTENGRWLAAGDTGPDYAAIVWDLQQDAIPMRIYCRPNGKEAKGLTSICFSPNMRFLAMLSAGEKQILTLYEWLVDRKGQSDAETPVAFYQLPDGETLQAQLSFNPLDQEMLISCSKERVILYQWHVAETEDQDQDLGQGQGQGQGRVRICIPDTKKVPSFSPIGDITRAVFIPTASYLAVGSAKGLVALFRKRTTHKKVQAFEEYSEIVGVYRVVSNASVTALTSFNGMIVVGDSLGNVSFYDCNLLILYKCNGISLGEINTVSFARLQTHRELSTKFEKKTQFQCEFAVGTSSGYIVNVRTTGSDLFDTHVIREEPRDTVTSCAVHPNAHRLILGSSCGLLRVWDYKQKTILVQRRFGHEGAGYPGDKDITAVAFDPTGFYVACGFASGDLCIVKAVDLTEETGTGFCDSFGQISFVEFSDNGIKMATADSQGTVCLYRNNTSQWSPTWSYVGCHQAHNGPVLGLSFVTEHNGEKERLFTLGLDNCLVEYDLESSGNGDLLILYRELVDQEAQTFSFAYHPPVDNKESFLITANDKYKLKLWNMTTKMCRKTVNGPLQGSPVMGYGQLHSLPIGNFLHNAEYIARLTVLPMRDGNPNRYLLWRNAESVGLMALPLDGNPYRYCSRRVHPLGVTCMAISANGRFVFTAGGPEACVHMWSVHPEILEATLEGKKDTLVPFFDLLEGGMDGELYKDLEEGFCYLQLKAQGFETRDTRMVLDLLPLQELPNLFCALSFYPSERERRDVINEIKFSKYAESGLLVSSVDVSTALRAFVNHRPMWGVQYPEVIKAFAKFGFEELRTTIKPAQLVQILKGVGESMTEEEAVKTLGILMNLRPALSDWETVGAERDDYKRKMTLPKELTVQQVIEEVLAFRLKDASYGGTNPSKD